MHNIYLAVALTGAVALVFLSLVALEMVMR